MIKLLKGFDIRIRIMSAEHKHHRFCGTVIGSYDGVYGVMLDTGEVDHEKYPDCAQKYRFEELR